MRAHHASMLPDLTLTLGIVLDLLTASFSLYVAWRVHQAIRLGLPLRQTLLFWYGLAGFLVLDGGYAMVVLSTHVPPPIPLMVLMARRFLFLLGTYALVAGLLSMAKRARLQPYALAYYAILITAIEALTLYENPQSHVVLTWSIQFVYEASLPDLANFAIGIAIFLPLAAASVLATMRYRVQQGRDQRFRLLAFTLSVLAFCVGVVIGFWDNDWFWYGLFEDRLAFSIVAGMLFALRPPWIARQFKGISRDTSLEAWPR
jgi:hypothetical protein